MSFLTSWVRLNFSKRTLLHGVGCYGLSKNVSEDLSQLLRRIFRWRMFYSYAALTKYAWVWWIYITCNILNTLSTEHDWSVGLPIGQVRCDSPVHESAVGVPLTLVSCTVRLLWFRKDPGLICSINCFFLHPERLWGPRSLLSNGYRWLFPWG
jgi:hypothetical protein